MICALLVFQSPDLPAPLTELSPWLDWLIAPQEEVYARLDAQDHRRVIKTHTPLDGIPLDARATYIVVARHPLDMAVSLYHHSANIDRERVRQLTGQPGSLYTASPRPSLREWVLRWIGAVVDPRAELDSLPGVMLHLSDAWARRAGPGVVLVHYDDLLADLEGEMRRLAGLLGIAVPGGPGPRWWPRPPSTACGRVPTGWCPPRRACSWITRRSSGAGHPVRAASCSPAPSATAITPARPRWRHQACSAGCTGRAVSRR